MDIKKYINIWYTQNKSVTNNYHNDNTVKARVHIKQLLFFKLFV